MDKKLLILPFFALVASCGSARAYVPYAYGTLNETFSAQTGESYSSAWTPASFVHVGEDVSATYSEMYNDGTRFCLPSIGEQKLLVIPVDFADSSGDEGDLPLISQAFFGANGSRRFPSVAEYYDLSSYGRLHLQGRVASSFFRSPYSVSELASISGARKTKQTLQEIYRAALRWYDEAHPEDPSANYACLDRKGRAFVPVYFVYSAPYASAEETRRDSMLWAFTINDPAPISWTSIAMIKKGDEVDAHTCVHETGHLLGLPDYYDAEGETNLSSPLGRIDMMDCSLGDHNPFTKFALGWIRPILLDPEKGGRVTLRPFGDSGDAILLSTKSFRKTPYEEYLLLSFYTPGPLSHFDASMRKNETMKMPDDLGVLAYQVDARLGIYPRNVSSPSGYLTSSSDLTGKNVFYYADNSGGKRVGEEIVGDHLLTLIEASKSAQGLTPYFLGASKKEDGEGYAARDVFFREGMGMNENAFRDFAFHESPDQRLTHSWKVEEVQATYATISFLPRIS